jgi:hypothetical protein
MLVGFIGAPCSGKTTTAAKLFAALKDMGLPSEYIAEKARSYIAAKKFALRADNREHLFSLGDEDQIAIAHTQYRAELTMNTKDVVVVTDSAVLNSLLYMTPSAQNSESVLALMREAVSKYDILFVCAPVPRPAGEDPNRVHDEAASFALHAQIERLLAPLYAGKVVHVLTGSSHERLAAAFSEVLKAFVARNVDKVAEESK